MSQVSDWQSAQLDTETPSAARMYDYALGGAHNFAADRAAAKALWAALPDAPLVARSNRAFLRRAVRYCIEQGIDQFLDLGSGIPTVGNVHEIAQQLNPQCRVVYVDNESVAVASTRNLLAGNPNAAIVAADLRDVDAVLGAPHTQRLLNFTAPIGLIMVAVLHYIPAEANVPDLVARYTATLVPGSHLAVSHTTWDPRPEVQATLENILRQTGTPLTHRSREDVATLFKGLELVDPGVVWTPQWRPTDDADPLHESPERSATFAAVGRLPS
jgi:hypothetical protein